MSSNIGPNFAYKARAPQEWNETSLMHGSQVALQISANVGILAEVHSASLREQLLQGQEQWIYIAHIIREDFESYYAFASVLERALFLALRDLDAIGPKTAAQVLAALGVEKLSAVLHQGIVKGTKIPGLGPKTIEKLVHGMQSNKEVFLKILAHRAPFAGTAVSGGAHAPLAILQAMEKLGLRTTDAERLYTDLIKEDAAIAELEAAAVIRLLLQRWGQQRMRQNAELSGGALIDVGKTTARRFKRKRRGSAAKAALE